METFLQNLKASLAHGLNAIEADNKAITMIAHQAVKLYSKGMAQLKEFIAQYRFKDEQEEIFFFKKSKPSIQQHLIFYKKVFDIEMERPVGGIADVRAYLTEELHDLHRFYQKNKQLYQYSLLERSDMDHEYFLRKTKNIASHADSLMLSSEKDETFCAPCGYKTAKIMANMRLAEYLGRELEKLENPPKSGGKFPENFQWTGSKSDYAELVYGLQLTGSVNHGNAGIKEISTALGAFFNVDFGDLYGTFTDIKLRKNGYTTFIDRMKKNIVQKIEDGDRK